MEFRWFCRQTTESFPKDSEDQTQLLYKNGDFILDAVLSHPALSNTDKIVFTYWLIQARRYHPSSGNIAKKLGKDRRTVRKSINRLKELKVLEELPTSKTNDATRYKITMAFALEVAKFVKTRYGPKTGFVLEEAGKL